MKIFIVLILLFFCTAPLLAEKINPPDLQSFSCTLSFTSDELAQKAFTTLHKEWGVFPSTQYDFGPPPVWNLKIFSDDPKIHRKLRQMAPSMKGKFKDCVQRSQSDKPRKPVIYLYPRSPQETRVQLYYRGSFTATYPDYDENIKGWRVMAHPDGHLINFADGLEYNYLFWEGIDDSKDRYDLSNGFVVKGSDTKNFLQETLKRMGLTPREYNEFIVYWLPLMQKHPYNLIHFAEKEYTDLAPLQITPPPDSLLRVFMVFKALDGPTGVVPQSFKPFSRKGFTVIEWGGTEIRSQR